MFNKKLKRIFCILFFVINNNGYAQISYHKGSDERLDSIRSKLSNQVDILIYFDKDGQVSKIDRLKNDRRDGLVYYFTKNKLDSIRRFSNGVATSEIFTFSKNGKLIKHVLLDGFDMDTALSLKNRTFSYKTSTLLQGRNSQIFEMDKNATLKRIYDVNEKSSTPYKPVEYDFYISGGYNIYSIINLETEECITFSNGELSGIYTYQNGKLNGFSLLFEKSPQSIIKELSFWTDGKKQHELLKFKKNGTISSNR